VPPLPPGSGWGRGRGRGRGGLERLPLFLGALIPLAWPEDDERAPARASLASPRAPQHETLTSPATERAVEAGLLYLATLQARSGDGSFAIGDVERGDYAPLGVSALCTLAFLAAGSAPERGPHGEVVARALEYLLLHTDLDPRSSERGYISVQGDMASQNHGHGYATLVLAQAYGMSSGSERIRAALVAAVERIEESQGAEGGWFYQPRPTSDHEGSVTICLVQALRAARDAGVQVDGQVIRRAEDYVRRLQLENGLFRYTLGDEKRASIALTAAGIATLNAAGRYDDGAVQDGIDAIWSGLALREEGGRPADFPEYERLYLAQAFWQLSDTSHFARWFADERERILRTQAADGSWKGSRFGSAYVTAVNCLVLSLPDAVLPIFQR
jgi:hypothetical protein